MTTEALSANLSPETAPGSDSTADTGTSAHEPTTQRETPSLPHSCKCGARWGGGNTAHCAAQCHLTFSTPGTFDKHRRDGHCLDPVSVGLEAKERNGYTAWGYPGDERLGTNWGATEESR